MLTNFWVYVNLFFSILQVPIGLWVQGAFGRERSPVVPAGYAFGIWGPIFAGSIVYSFFQLAPASRSFFYLRKIAPFTATAFFLSCLWMVVAKWAHQPLLWVTIPVIAAMLLVLACAFFPLHAKSIVLNPTEKWCVLYPISLYFGWISVAIFANIASVFADRGFSPLWFSAALVVLGGVFGAWITVMSHNLVYGFAVLWGLIGVMVANFTVYNWAMIATAFLMSVLVGSALFKSFR